MNYNTVPLPMVWQVFVEKIKDNFKDRNSLILRMLKLSTELLLSFVYKIYLNEFSIWEVYF
jgi:hypothetical protein